MASYKVIGKRIPRTDGKAIVTGAAKYSEDFCFPNMLYGKILRSPYAHAKILHIDTTKAEKLIGVKGIVTGRDSSDQKLGAHPALMDRDPLAKDKVRFIGDEIAAVAAIDKDVAEEALSLIKVEYEELPAVFTPEEAMTGDAPEVHEKENNIAFGFTMNLGDEKKALSESSIEKEDTFIIPVVATSALEPHCSVALVDEYGRLALWSSSQVPFRVKKDLARILGLPEEKVRAIKPYVGGSFCGKVALQSGDVSAALLAMKTQRPVKLALSREEVFVTGGSSTPVKIAIRAGMSKAGKLNYFKAKIIADNGAYTNHSFIALLNSAWNLNYPYKIDSLSYEGYLVYTNNPPSHVKRGGGSPELFFAVESLVDQLAVEAGIDPFDFRLMNSIGSSAVTLSKFRVNSCGMKECLTESRKRASSPLGNNATSSNTGKGVACGAHTGAGARIGPHDSATALVSIEDNGKVTLWTGASDIGQGSDTILCQILAEELGVGLKDVSKVKPVDTTIAPPDLGTFGSRVTFIAGNAVRNAAKEAKKQILEVVAEKIGVSPKDLGIKDSKIYNEASQQECLSFPEAVLLCYMKGRPILARGFYDTKTEPFNPQTGEGNFSGAFTFGAQVAEVEIDLGTGLIEVKRIVAAHDVGFAINPMFVEGQIEGSVAMGLGQALMEETLLEEGRIINPSFLDYKVPFSMDVPEIEPVAIESNDPEGPFGAKGMGEAGAIPTAPAIGNAVYAVLKERINSLPLTPEKILKRVVNNKDL